MGRNRVSPLSEWQVMQRISRWLEWSAAAGTSSVYRGGIGGGGSTGLPEGLARACDVGMAISRCPPVTLRGGQRVPAVEVVSRLKAKMAWATETLRRARSTGECPLTPDEERLADRFGCWRDAVRIISRSLPYRLGVAYLARRWAEADAVDSDSAQFWLAVARAASPAERLRDLVDRWSLSYKTIVKLLDSDDVTEDIVRNWLRNPDSSSHTPPPYGAVLQIEAMLDGVPGDGVECETGGTQ